MKTYTFWKNLRNGAIYKYEFGTKPLNADPECATIRPWKGTRALKERKERK